MFEFNKQTEWILGRPNFWCTPIAVALRVCGRDIKKHAEEEQAAVIYWMLEMYEKHGNNWKAEGQKWLEQNSRRAGENIN